MSFVNKPLTDIMDCVRASTATYVDPTGKIRTAGVNEPRIDFSSGQGRLLVEEVRTNFLLRSEELDSAVHSPVRMIFSTNQIIAPDGLQTADKCIPSTELGLHSMRMRHNYVSGERYTLSFFVKSDGVINNLAINVRAEVFGEVGGINFNINTGDVNSVSFASGNNYNFSSLKLANGWLRVSLSVTALLSDTDSLRGFWLRFTDSSSSFFPPDFEGDGTSGVYIWGLQLEQASTPSSYIPTQASAVTRAADNVSRVLGDEFNGSEGSVYFDININSISMSSTEFIHESDTGYRFLYRLNSSPLVFRTFDGSNVQTLNGSATVGRHKVVVSYKAGMAIASVDGTITPSFTFNPTNFGSVFGVNTRITSGLSSKATDFNKVRYYPKALSQSECEELTRI